MKPSTAAAACAKLTFAGIGAIEARPDSRRYSAAAPTANPVNPNTDLQPVCRRPYRRHLTSELQTEYANPLRGRRSPIISRPRRGSPRRIPHSADVTVAACTRISTWSPRTAGTGKSTRVSTSGGPYARNIAALMPASCGSEAVTAL